MKAQQLAKHIADLMLEKKASHIVIQDLRGLTSITDFFVICTADSEPQAKAIKEHVKSQLVQQSIRPWHTEGKNNSNWILMDFVDVVVHIFKNEARQYYTLERLWGDAKITEIKDSDETTGTHSD